MQTTIHVSKSSNVTPATWKQQNNTSIGHYTNIDKDILNNEPEPEESTFNTTQLKLTSLPK